MVLLKRAETTEELKGILTLQKANLIENLSSNLKEEQGFVTVKHDLKTLELMNEHAKQIIAVENDEVIGYALVMMKELRDLVPVLIPFFNMLEKIEFNDKALVNSSFYVMGQICVAKNYRGQGIVKLLYQKHQEVYADQYELCITEVSTSNARSMRAHQKVGFEVIHVFQDQTDEWNILGWNFSDP